MATAAIHQDNAAGNAVAEAALCGSLMLQNGLIDSIADKLTEEDFFDPFMGRVFSAIVQEASKGRGATPVTLKPYFDDEGYKVLCGLTGSGAQLGAAKDCASQVKELARKRRLVEGLGEVLADARRGDVDVAALVSASEGALAAVVEDDARQIHCTASEAVRKVVENIGQAERGVACHIAPIDAALGAILPKHLVVLAGRPSMGKSAVASSMGLGAALHGHGVLFVSLEMSAEELGERIVCDLSFDGEVQVPYSAVTNGTTTNEQNRQMARGIERLDCLPFAIADLSAITIGRLNALVRRECRKFQAKGKKLELVIVDYLQLVRPDRPTDNRTHEITQVSMGLKAIAKEHGVGVLALAQLNRSVEQRSDKRPILADLRESGQIEQDADSIIFLYRPEYYLQQAEPAPHDPKHIEWEGALAEHEGKIEFIVAKRRRGRTGTTKGRFFGAYQAVRA